MILNDVKNSSKLISPIPKGCNFDEFFRNFPPFRVGERKFQFLI